MRCIGDPLHKKTVRVWNTHGSSPLLLFFLGAQQRRADDACVSCKAGSHNTRLLCAATRIAVFSHVGAHRRHYGLALAADAAAHAQHLGLEDIDDARDAHG